MARGIAAFAYLFLCISAIRAASITCNPGCNFEMCGGRISYYVPSTPGKVFSGQICSKKGERIGVVSATGEAHRFTGRHAYPISIFNPPGLSQKFDADFFKAFTFSGGKVSGVGHGSVRGNQKNYLNDVCWILPIKAYQVLDNSGNVIENRNVDDKFKECIAFRTLVAQ